MEYKVNEDGTIEKEVEETEEVKKPRVSETLVNGFLYAACAGLVLSGYMLGVAKEKRYWKEKIKIAVDANDRENHSRVREMLKKICPQTGVKYVVERFDEDSGYTYGALANYMEVIEDSNAQMLNKLNTGLSRLADNLENLKKEA